MAAEFQRTLCGGAAPDPADVAFTQAALRTSPRGFLEVLAETGLDQGAPLLLVVDQFEEIFRFRRRRAAGGSAGDGGRAVHEERNDASAFVNLLLATAGAAAKAAPSLYVMITMRSDFIGDCDLFPGLPQAVSDSQFLVPRLTRRQMQEVIEKPLLLFGIRASPELVNQMLNDAGTDPDQLPLMQHALMRIWFAARARSGGGNQEQTLTLADYHAVGQFSDALSQHLEEAWTTLAGEREQRIAHQLFLCLSEQGDGGALVRRMVRLGEAAAVANVDPGEVASVVRVFQAEGRNFIVASPPGGLGADSVLDISHEALLRQWPRLRSWIEEEAGLAGRYVRLADGAARWKTGDAELLRGRDLERALEWQQKRNPTAAWAARYHPGFADAVEFLARSREAGEERKRRARIRGRTLRIGAAAVCVILAVFACWAMWSAKQAKHSKALAEKSAAEAEWHVYLYHILAAERELEAANPATASNHLHQCSPAFRNWEYYYLQTLLTRNQKTLDGHKDPVGVVAFSPDGARILSADWGGALKLWDARTGREQPGFTQGYPAGFNYDRSRTVSAVDAGDGRNWAFSARDIRTGRVVWTLPGNSVLGYSCMACSPDGSQIVSAERRETNERDHPITLWDTRQGGRVLTLHGHTGPVSAAAFSPDGSQIVSASLDGALKLWDTRTGTNKSTFKGHSGPVHAAAFSPRGARIVSGGGDGIKLWDARGGEVERLTLKETGEIQAVAFSSQGDRIVSGGTDKTVKVWDARTGELKTVLVGHNYNVNAVAFSPDGRQIASGAGERHAGSGWSVFASGADENYRGELKLWDVSGENPITEETNHISALAFSPDGGRIASGGAENILKLWDARTGAVARELDLRATGGAGILDVAFSPDGRRIVTGSGPRPGDTNDTPTVRVWDTLTGTEALKLGGAPSGYGRSVAFSPDGRRIAASCDDGRNPDLSRVLLWDARTGAQVRTMRGFHSFVAFSPDGARIASLKGHVIQIWDAISGEEKLTVSGRGSGNLCAAAFSPDGSVIVSGDLDGSLRVWNASTGGLNLTLAGHAFEVSALAFSPDGKRIVSSGADRMVKLWDAGTGDEVLSFRGLSSTARSPVAFSPDGRQILNGGGDGIWLWEALSSDSRTRERAGQKQKP